MIFLRRYWPHMFAVLVLSVWAEAILRAWAAG